MASDDTSPNTDPSAADKQKAAEDARKAVLESAEKFTEDVKKSLEYTIAGKTVTVNKNGTLITFKKWGLTNKLTLGVKVNSIFKHIQGLFPDSSAAELLSDESVVATLITHLAQSVMEIVARSMTEPFLNANEAMVWIDDNCNHSDLLELAVIVWDMNLRGDDLGKASSGVTEMTKSLKRILNP